MYTHTYLHIDCAYFLAYRPPFFLGPSIGSEFFFSKNRKWKGEVSIGVQQKVQLDIRAHQRLRSSCASAQSDQSLWWALYG